MAVATVREFRADPNGVMRLMAAVGEEAPAGNAVAPAPPAPVMGPADYSATPVTDYLQTTAPPVATAGNDFTHAIGTVKRAGTVTAASYIPDATITGAATNNRTVSIVNKGSDGLGSTVVATLNFASGVNATAADEKVLTLSATPANLVVAAGDVLAFSSGHIGTGIADPGGLVTVSIRPTAS
jgi:hypothetical protein